MAWSWDYHQVIVGFEHLSNSTTLFRAQAHGGVQSYPDTHTERGRLGLMKSIQSQCRLQWPHQRSPPTQRFFASVAFPLLDAIWIFLNGLLSNQKRLSLSLSRQELKSCCSVFWEFSGSTQKYWELCFLSPWEMTAWTCCQNKNFSIFLNNYKLILINTCFLKKWKLYTAPLNNALSSLCWLPFWFFYC